MNTLLWSAQFTLAAIFSVTGAMKLFLSREQLIAKMGTWPEAFTPVFLKSIAIAELAGVIGILVPWWTGILPMLTPIAAGGLTAILLGATRMHWRRREFTNVVLNTALIALSVFVAWGRWLG